VQKIMILNDDYESGLVIAEARPKVTAFELDRLRAEFFNTAQRRTQ